MMTMNIKNAESPTASVTVAVRERLSRVKVERAGGLAERLMQIGREAAAHMTEPFLSIEHGELLYDEEGPARRKPSR